MKKTLILFLAALPFIAKAQVLQIEGGTSLSHLNYNVYQIDLFDQNTTMFTGNVGVRYLQKSNFSLSSSIGYLQKGGKGNLDISDVNGNFIGKAVTKALFNYITLNTIARIEYAKNNKLVPFINLGLYCGYLVSTSDNLIIENFNKLNFGGVAGIGIYKKLSKNEIGFQVNYLPPFNKQLSKKDVYGGTTTVSSNTFTATFFIGFKFKK